MPGIEKKVIVVEDDRIGMSPEALHRAVLDHLRFTRGKDVRSATLVDVYHALAHAARDRLIHRWINTQRTYNRRNVKRAYYLSAEYLLGRQLARNLHNLGIYELARTGLTEYGIDLDDVLVQEEDPGLGNGGLGRLAACFLDSLATQRYPAMGYGIRYEFGIFRQAITNGWQEERPDTWLRNGNPWEITRTEYSVHVRYGGTVQQWRDEEGHLRVRWFGGETVVGVPFDTPIAGFRSETVNTLRLWAARATEEFELAVFNEGDYRRAVEQKSMSESISKVLYPQDDTAEGKELRLKQQYFFVACSIQDILRRFKEQNGKDFTILPEKAAIQLNDTHPAIAVAELMRLLLDVEGVDWDIAWGITRRTIAYTNHTLLPEALECWSLELFERLLPRHMQIIYEINHRFLRRVHMWAPNDYERQRRMSIIDEGPPRQIRMAHLAVVGSHMVNGVAELHSQLLKDRVLADLAQMFPNRFINITNGVTPRRWLLECNMPLANVLSERLGLAWVKDLSELTRLEPLVDDPEFLRQLAEVKHFNKVRLARHVARHLNESIDPNSLFDVQVKRIHEYKRQLLTCLHVVHLYWRIKFNGESTVPRTVLIAGKAAPGYVRAKQIIKFINDIAAIVNADPSMSGRLRVVFLPNYNVSLAERIIPAADLSEQISLAGKEASGTGNMKFQMNGALTIGTLDGANVEIREEVGADNFFLFGMDTQQVATLREQGYRPSDFIVESDALRATLDLVGKGFFNPDEPDVHIELARYLREDDPFMVCADFDAYLEAQERASAAWMDKARWWPMVARNIARAGKFSADRSIREYAAKIWQIEPAEIEDNKGREE